MSETITLGPCPFCGGGAEVYPEESDAGYYVACFQPQYPITECFASLGEEYDRDAMPEHRFQTKEEAATAWNTRLGERTIRERVSKLEAAVKRAAWDFTILIDRGDLAEEPRAKQTLKILRAALVDQQTDLQGE